MMKMGWFLVIAGILSAWTVLGGASRPEMSCHFGSIGLVSLQHEGQMYSILFDRTRDRTVRLFVHHRGGFGRSQTAPLIRMIREKRVCAEESEKSRPLQEPQVEDDLIRELTWIDALRPLDSQSTRTCKARIKSLEGEISSTSYRLVLDQNYRARLDLTQGELFDVSSLKGTCTPLPAESLGQSWKALVDTLLKRERALLALRTEAEQEIQELRSKTEQLRSQRKEFLARAEKMQNDGLKLSIERSYYDARIQRQRETLGELRRLGVGWVRGKD